MDITLKQLPKTVNGINESEHQTKHRILGSARLTYSLCAFLALTLQLCMRNSLSLTILYMNQELLWPRFDVILLISCFYIGFCITMPIAGRICDRFGGKCCFILSLGVESLLYLGTPWFVRVNYTVAVATRALQGFVSGFGNPSLYQLLSVWAHPIERTALSSFVYMGFSFGTLLIFPLADYLCQFGWPVVFYSIGSIGISFSLLCNWLVYSDLDSHPRLTKEEYNYLKRSEQNEQKMKIPWKNILTSVPVHAFIITHVSHSFGIVMFSLLLPIYFKEVIQTDLKQVGGYAAIPFFGAFVSKVLTIVSCTCSHKKFIENPTLLRRAVYVFCSCITILALFGISQLDSRQIVYVLVLLFAFGVTTDVAFSVGYWVSILDFAPAYSGLITGIANSCSTLVTSMSPILIVTLTKNNAAMEWYWMLCSMILLYLLATISYGLFGSSDLQNWAIKKNKNSQELS